MRPLSLLLCTLFLGGTMSINAQTAKNAEIPIKKVSLFSSGVGFFEHQGTIEGNAKLTLPFETGVMNDVLKSLTIYDPTSSAPLVSYPSEETLRKTLESLKVNLSNNPSIEQILNSLRGAEVDVYAPGKITGKIIGTEAKETQGKDGDFAYEYFLSLLSENKIQVIAIKDIASYGFSDPKISADLNRALELILNSSNERTKNIYITLPSTKKRDVSLSYVIASPVWKATYRLELDSKKPFLQGWAIVDNAGDTDWKGVELSLVVGRPVSFIQPLYAPYYVNRPFVPLSIAGVAEAVTYDSGYDMASMAEESAPYAEAADMKQMSRVYAPAPASISARNKDISAQLAQNYQTANAKASGEQFVFTVKNPVTLERQQSAMIPLIQSNFDARKVSIFRGASVYIGQSANPALGVELKNTSGMKLPAGPIVVYDEGSYAGDALIEFFGENEKRFISYGDDLAVSGVVSQATNSYIDTVKISKGILQINSKGVHKKEYTFKNNADKAKNLILEHPLTANAKLVEPAKYSEKTGNLYRFDILLPSNKELKYSVKEEYPISQSVGIFNLDINSLIAYSNNEFPKSVKDALKKAVNLANAISNVNDEIAAANSSLEAKENEQERIRQNLEAVGRESVQGKDYLTRMSALDRDIDAINAKLETLEGKLQTAKKAYTDYINSLDI